MPKKTRPVAVVDASAILAMLKTEVGWDRVASVLPNSAVTAINAAEVFSKLSEWKASKEMIDKVVAILDAVTVPFDKELAFSTGMLSGPTRSAGLSLGDRACLAMAQRLDIPALTADQAWGRVDVKVKVEFIRQAGVVRG